MSITISLSVTKRAHHFSMWAHSFFLKDKSFFPVNTPKFPLTTYPFQFLPLVSTLRPPKPLLYYVFPIPQCPSLHTAAPHPSLAPSTYRRTLQTFQSTVTVVFVPQPVTTSLYSSYVIQIFLVNCKFRYQVDFVVNLIFNNFIFVM